MTTNHCIATSGAYFLFINLSDSDAGFVGGK